MLQFILDVEKISKKFTLRKAIFRDKSFRISNGDIYAITGPNGSGKTTLLRILAGIMKPSSGRLSFKVDGKTIQSEYIYRYISFVGPYLNLYEEFTPLEHLRIFAQFREIPFSLERARFLLSQFNLQERANDYIRTFSSGMKQRMKYVLSMQHESLIYMFDEPMTNLDQSGIAAVMNTIFSHQSLGGAIIIATNDEREKSICKKILSMED